MVIGIGTYYVIPLSFLNEDWGNMFFLLNMLLLLVVVGFTLLCVLLFKHGEKLLLWILLNTCFKKDRQIHQLIVKNMQGHNARNSKTSIMFTLAVSFLIFASSAFESIANMSQRQATAYIGADIYIHAGYTT